MASVLSGNRNFEGRINPEVRANYLMSPPLVVAYALAGRIDIDLDKEPLGIGQGGKPVFLKDIWPTQQEVNDVVEKRIKPEMFTQSYGDVLQGRRALAAAERSRRARPYVWDAEVDLHQAPAVLRGHAEDAGAGEGHQRRARAGGAGRQRHHRPHLAGGLDQDRTARREYLIEHGVKPADFNSYGSRRGNHEVMVRGTFANVRLRNKLAPEPKAACTRHLPDGEEMSIFDASDEVSRRKVPLIVLAGKEYGSGRRATGRPRGRTCWACAR